MSNGDVARLGDHTDMKDTVSKFQVHFLFLCSDAETGLYIFFHTQCPGRFCH